jgi:hypothetical protein
MKTLQNGRESRDFKLQYPNVAGTVCTLLRTHETKPHEIPHMT